MSLVQNKKSLKFHYQSGIGLHGDKGRLGDTEGLLSDIYGYLSDT